MTLATVIVGASIGGVRTAQALRSAGYQGEITLVGDESALPYDRPPLSKGLLAGTATPESITLLTQPQAAKPSAPSPAEAPPKVDLDKANEKLSSLLGKPKE